MSGRKKLAKINEIASGELADTLNILKALYQLHWEDNINSTLITIAKSKAKIAFDCVEKN